MLTTAAEARNRVCLMNLASRDNPIDAGACRGDACSAWHWEAAGGGVAAAERLGYCGMVGCVKRVVRKRPRRTVEETTAAS